MQVLGAVAFFYIFAFCRLPDDVHGRTPTRYGGFAQTLKGHARPSAALGLKPLQDADWVKTLGPITRLQLQVRPPTVMHEVTIEQLRRWLDGALLSPHEAIRKAKLKSILE